MKLENLQSSSDIHDDNPTPTSKNLALPNQKSLELPKDNNTFGSDISQEIIDTTHLSNENISINNEQNTRNPRGSIDVHRVTNIQGNDINSHQIDRLCTIDEEMWNNLDKLRDKPTTRHNIMSDDKNANFLRNIVNEVVASRTGRKPKVTHATFRLIYLIIVFILFRNRSGFVIIASIMFMIQTYFYGRLLYALYASEQIYRIWLYTKQLPHTSTVVYPYKVVHFPKIPVSSISEWIAISGSTFHDLLLAGSERLTALQLAAAAFLWRDSIVLNPGNNLDLVFFFTGTIGQFLVVQFVLHPEDSVFVILHYIGAVSIVFEGIAFGFQQNWNIIALLLNIIGVVGFIVWQILKQFADVIPFLAKKHEDPKIVKRTSVILMVPEIISTYAFSLCGVFFVYCMQGDTFIGPKRSFFK